MDIECGGSVDLLRFLISYQQGYRRKTHLLHLKKIIIMMIVTVPMIAMGNFVRSFFLFLL